MISNLFNSQFMSC